MRNEVIGDFHRAIDDFTRAIEINPQSPAAFGARGVIYIEHRDYDKGIADIKEAIRLNPHDLGQNFQPSTDKSIDPAALAHGEVQVRKMLADRPRMAEHVQKNDPLWNWAVRKFAGEDLGSPIDWDPMSPDPFPASGVGASSKLKHGMIHVNLLQQGLLDRPEQTFEELWSCTVFELYNITNTPEWERISADSDSGEVHARRIYPGDDAKRVQYGSTTRAFYLNFFLPWLRSKHLDPTCPDRWHCEDYRNPELCVGSRPSVAAAHYLSFYENTYDMQAAYRAGNGGNYVESQRNCDTRSSPTLLASTQMNSSEPTDSPRLRESVL